MIALRFVKGDFSMTFPIVESAAVPAVGSKVDLKSDRCGEFTFQARQENIAWDGEIVGTVKAVTHSIQRNVQFAIIEVE